MEHPPAGASRFQVVFGRSSGSRKQRARREGILSVGYHSSFLYDTDAKECVMKCKGTGVLPNPIFAKMQAARRGAAWTTGTVLTLNGFEVVIEDVMKLHLIPYSEDANAEAATTTTTATTTVGDKAVLALPESAVTSHVYSRRLSVHRGRVPTAANREIPPSSNAGAADSAVRLPLLTCAGADERAAAVCVRRIRLRNRDDAVGEKPARRGRRSEASVARELRACYPQYF